MTCERVVSSRADWIVLWVAVGVGLLGGLAFAWWRRESIYWRIDRDAPQWKVVLAPFGPLGVVAVGGWMVYACCAYDNWMCDSPKREGAQIIAAPTAMLVVGIVATFIRDGLPKREPSFTEMVEQWERDRSGRAARRRSRRQR